MVEHHICCRPGSTQQTAHHRKALGLLYLYDMKLSHLSVYGSASFQVLQKLKCLLYSVVSISKVDVYCRKSRGSRVFCVFLLRRCVWRHGGSNGRVINKRMSSLHSLAKNADIQYHSIRYPSSSFGPTILLITATTVCLLKRAFVDI